MKCSHITMKKTYLKYLIFKVRQKLSYSAFLKNQTILELFAHVIHKSYFQLVRIGKLEINPLMRELIGSFEDMLQGDASNILSNIILVNSTKGSDKSLFDERIAEMRRRKNQVLEVIKVIDKGK